MVRVRGDSRHDGDGQRDAGGDPGDIAQQSSHHHRLYGDMAQVRPATIGSRPITTFHLSPVARHMRISCTV
jgi:hypothetical protein